MLPQIIRVEKEEALIIQAPEVVEALLTIMDRLIQNVQATAIPITDRIIEIVLDLIIVEVITAHLRLADHILLVQEEVLQV